MKIFKNCQTALVVLWCIALLSCTSCGNPNKVNGPIPVKVMTESSQGSGVLIESYGSQRVITNAHVLGLPIVFEVEMPNGSRHKAVMSEKIVLTLGPEVGTIE